MAVGFKLAAEAAGMFFGGEPAEPRMRAAGVEVLAPGLEDLAGVADRAEQGLVEKLVPEPPVEALGEGVLDRLAGLDVFSGHAPVVRPGQDRVRGELGSIVADDRRRAAPGGDDGVQLPRHPDARERRVRE